MIIAEFFKKDGGISGFKISGHADFDQYGRDIACASVSSAVQLSANLITDVFGFKAEVSAENNSVVLKAVSFKDSTLQKLFDGLLMQLDLLSQEFEKTIEIRFTEV